MLRIPFIKPPDVKLVSLSPERFRGRGQRLRIGLRVQNPNLLPLPVPSMTFQLWLEERFVASGEGELHQRVPARGSADLEVLVDSAARDLLRLLPTLARKRQPWHYRLEGAVALPAQLKLPYRHAGRIDLAGMLRLIRSLR